MWKRALQNHTAQILQPRGQRFVFSYEIQLEAHLRGMFHRRILDPRVETAYGSGHRPLDTFDHKVRIRKICHMSSRVLSNSDMFCFIKPGWSSQNMRPGQLNHWTTSEVNVLGRLEYWHPLSIPQKWFTRMPPFSTGFSSRLVSPFKVIEHT